MIHTMISGRPVKCDWCDWNAIALVQWDTSYVEWKYCIRCLEQMFDAVDNSKKNHEPTNVTWIRHPNSRWCLKHHWHWLLCETWWHAAPDSPWFGQDQVALWEARTRATVASPGTTRGDG